MTDNQLVDERIKGTCERWRDMISQNWLLTGLSIFTTGRVLSLVERDDDNDFGLQWSDTFEPTAMLEGTLG